MSTVIRDDMAFIDHLPSYLPGWEIPKMRNDLFTDHYGFVVDYAAMIAGDLMIDVSNFDVEVVDLLNNRTEGELGLAHVMPPSPKRAPPVSAMLVLGDLSIQGNIKKHALFSNPCSWGAKQP